MARDNANETRFREANKATLKKAYRATILYSPSEDKLIIEALLDRVANIDNL